MTHDTRWLVVNNPRAGSGRDHAGAVAAALDRIPIDYELVTPGDIPTLEAIIAAAAAGGVTRFAVAGGDGTANLALNALMALPWTEPPVLSILPTGSGSDFIRTFALPRTLEGAAGVLVGDRVYRCDVGLVHGSFGSRYFLNALDVGIAAAAVRIGRRLPRWMGSLRYQAAFWMALPGFPAAPVEVDLGRRRIAGDAINVVVANGQFFGGGLNIAPQAALMDGLLDVEVFRCSRRHAFSLMPRVVRGHHLRHRAVARGRLAEGSITAPEHWPVEVDGELLGTGSVRIEVVPGAIDFKI